MKTVLYDCDACGKPIDDTTHPIAKRDIALVGETSLYVLDYHGDGQTIMGNNNLPLHLHGFCFSLIVDAIVRQKNKIKEDFGL